MVILRRVDLNKLEQLNINSKTMKNLLFLFIAILLTSGGLVAQSVPEGLRYQAIARGLDGSLLIEKSLQVEVQLMAAGIQEKIFYSETHEVRSNRMGLLDLIIGEGVPAKGKFSDIPWVTEEVWVNVSMKSPGDEKFQIVSSGQLYSVPYALYADYAGELSEQPNDGSRAPNPGLNSINWTLHGNVNAQLRNNGKPVLGTTDLNDLVFITNNTTRLTIDKNGKATFKVNVEVAGKLCVSGATTLKGPLTIAGANSNTLPGILDAATLSGTLVVDKPTTLNDDLTVQNMAPTHMTGPLDVDQTLRVDGSTTVNNSLTVTGDNATILAGTLIVDKPTTLNHSLTVENMAPTHLTGSLDVDGTLNVDGSLNLNSSLDVTGMSPTNLSGTLRVDKATTLNDKLTVTNGAPTQLSGTLDVDKTLNVDQATTLNNKLDVTGAHPASLTGTLTVDLATVLYDNLKVDNLAPTQLTGTLDVDKTLNADGPLTLNNTLAVTGQSATILTGTLTVEKLSTLKDALTVSNMAPTHLTGDLDLDGAFRAEGTITLDGPLEVAGMNPTHLTGTLLVDKLAKLEAGAVVKGAGNVGPGGDDLAFFNNTEGGSSDGIAIRIQHTEPDKENNFMTFYRGSGNGVIGRIESYEFDDIADIPVPTSDEIWTAVCLGLADYNPITIAWTHFATGFNLVSSGWNNVTIPSFDIPNIPPFDIPNVPALTIPDVPAFVISDVPGFSIPDIPGVVIPDVPSLVVGPYLCIDVTVCACPCDILDPFNFDCCCLTVNECLIPQFTLFPGITLPDFPGIAIPDFPGIAIPDFPGIPIPDFPGITIPNFPGLVIPPVPEINLKNLFGEAPTIPTFSDILIEQGVCPDEDIFNLQTGYFARLAAWAIEHRLTSLVSLDPLKLAANVLTWGITTAVLDNGVVYGSKGADYAEYLPKVYASEKFMKGDVIGVFNGKISKNTRNADQILAITSQPLVLGNMPDEGEEKDFEQVAFLGQVPVYVKGPVSLGDYIVASGNNDGIAKAVSAKMMTTEMLSHVLGNAWSAYEGEGVSMITTSIGLRPMEISMVLKKQGEMEEKLAEQMQAQREGSEILSTDIDRMKQALGISVMSYNP